MYDVHRLVEKSPVMSFVFIRHNKPFKLCIPQKLGANADIVAPLKKLFTGQK